MKNSLTLLASILLGTQAMAQPVLVSGFNGMGAVNGTLYTHIGQAGDVAGGYAFVCASKDGAAFFSSSFSKQRVYWIDPATFAVTDSIAHSFYGIGASNEPGMLFGVTNSGLARVNTTTKTITDSVAVSNAGYMTERPCSKEVWVISQNKVAVVDYSSTLAVSYNTYCSSTTDDGEVKFTPGGSLAYKVAWSSNKVYKIDATTKMKTDSIVCGTSSPYAVAISSDSSRLFVTFPNDKKIRIYNTATMTITDSLSFTSREPFDVYHHPTRAEIWVVNHFKDSITVLSEASPYAQIGAFPVSSNPHSVAFGSGTVTSSPHSASADHLAAYPNPATGMLTLSGLQAGYTINVYDMNGKLCASGPVKYESQDVFMYSLQAGHYILEVVDTNGTTLKRMKVEKR